MSGPGRCIHLCACMEFYPFERCCGSRGCFQLAMASFASRLAQSNRSSFSSSRPATRGKRCVGGLCYSARPGTDWECASETGPCGRLVSAREMLGRGSLTLHLSRTRTNSISLHLTRTFPFRAGCLRQASAAYDLATPPLPSEDLSVLSRPP